MLYIRNTSVLLNSLAMTFVYGVAFNINYIVGVISVSCAVLVV